MPGDFRQWQFGKVSESLLRAEREMIINAGFQFSICQLHLLDFYDMLHCGGMNRKEEHRFRIILEKTSTMTRISLKISCLKFLEIVSVCSVFSVVTEHARSIQPFRILHFHSSICSFVKNFSSSFDGDLPCSSIVSFSLP